MRIYRLLTKYLILLTIAGSLLIAILANIRVIALSPPVYKIKDPGGATSEQRASAHSLPIELTATRKFSGDLSLNINPFGNADFLTAQPREVQKSLSNQQVDWPIAFNHVGLSVGTNISNTYALVAVDLDGDKDMDLVSGDYSGRIIAWQNDGTPFDGVWSQHLVGMSWAVISLAAGDLDNDGDSDLTSAQWHGPVIWENDGSPFDGEWTFRQIGDRTVSTISLADLNGNGRLDIVTGGGMPWWREPNDNNWITVWYAPTTPFSQDWLSTDIAQAYYTPTGLSIGDLDNDGDNDIVIGTDRAPAMGDAGNPVPEEAWPDVYQILSFQNDGEGGWTAFNIGRDPEIETLQWVGYHGYWGAAVTHVSLADLDDDGDPDIIATERVEGDFLVMGWQNDGTPFSGELWAPAAIAKGEEHNWLHDSVLWAEVGDFDFDGDLDVVSASRAVLEPWPLKLWENTGIAFGEVISETHWVGFDIPSPRQDIWIVRAVDFDQDGDLDLATATHSQVAAEPSEIRVWENTDFKLDLTPTSRIVNPGQVVTFTGTITAWHGFDQPLNLWISGLPNGIQAEWDHNPLVPPGSSVLTLSTPLDSVRANYPLLATAIGSNFVRTVPFSLTIKQTYYQYLPLVLRN